MAIGSWVVSSVIRLNHSGFTSGMASVSRSTIAANEQLQRQHGLITRNELAMRKYQRALEDTRATSLRMGTTIAGVGFAVGAAGLVAATVGAANFERAMTGVQIATGATAKQMKQLSDMAFHVSGTTAQGSTTIANEMARAAQVAFKDPKQLMAIFPMMAKYADVRWMATGGQQDPTETVGLMSSYAHMFSAYGVNAMSKMLDLSAKLQFSTDTSLQQLVTQGRMYIPNASKLGVSMDDIMQYTAIMSQTGFMKGRGGTALNNLILGAEGAVSPTATLSKARSRGLHDLGMFDSVGRFRFVDEKGHLMLDQMVRHLQAVRTQMEHTDARFGGGRWMTDIGAAFGKEAQRLVSVLADPATRGQMDRNQRALQTVPGVEGQWELYSRDLFYEWSSFTNDIENVGKALAIPNLPLIEHGFHAIDLQLLRLSDWLKQNPNWAQNIFLGASYLTSSLGANFLIGIGRASGAILGFGHSIDALTATLTRDSIVIGGAAAGAGGAGLLSRLKGLGGILLDTVTFGLGTTALKASSGAFKWATKAAGWLIDGAVNALRAGVTGYFARALKGGAAFNTGLIADMQKGFAGLIDLLFGPVQRAISSLTSFAITVAPKFSGLVDILIGSLGRLVGGLARILMAIPGVDIAALVLTPTSAGDDSAWVAAHPSRGRSAPVTIHGGVHFHIDHEDDDAAVRQWESFLSNLGGQHPLTGGMVKNGSFATHPRIANPALLSPNF
jgi:TP901 family phage tail tape measure protein